mmetsp:Transcript_47554/g.78927  ORF Transcript_47554/g.78927 Transcript_47554/m.78927 type:complete len:203 (+) Transcript_47554:1105-1713(+)
MHTVIDRIHQCHHTFRHILHLHNMLNHHLHNLRHLLRTMPHVMHIMRQHRLENASRHNILLKTRQQKLMHIAQNIIALRICTLSQYLLHRCFRLLLFTIIIIIIVTSSSSSAQQIKFWRNKTSKCMAFGALISHNHDRVIDHRRTQTMQHKLVQRRHQLGNDQLAHCFTTILEQRSHSAMRITILTQLGKMAFEFLSDAHDL